MDIDLAELIGPAVCVSVDTGECAGPVSFGPDPYRADVDNDDTPMWQCAHHVYESAQDI